jgi:hypothetical protein
MDNRFSTEEKYHSPTHGEKNSLQEHTSPTKLPKDRKETNSSILPNGASPTIVVVTKRPVGRPRKKPRQNPDGTVTPVLVLASKPKKISKKLQNSPKKIVDPSTPVKTPVKALKVKTPKKTPVKTPKKKSENGEDESSDEEKRCVLLLKLVIKFAKLLEEYQEEIGPRTCREACYC